MLLDTEPMERLRRVRQLGTTHLVYPGATHNRLSHCLGTLRASQDLLDAVVDNAVGPRTYKNHLFAHWREQGTELPEDEFPAVAHRAPGTTLLDLSIAEATVLARLGGLLHDLCHVPLGHTIEDDLGVLTPHDENSERFEYLWGLLRRDAPTAMGAIEESSVLALELRSLILSKEKNENGEPVNRASKYPFVMDIVGNTICADLMDYLRRDHYYCGLPLSLGNRFMNDFYVMHDETVRNKSKMVVRISRDGHPRADVVSELVKYLRFRYELSERVLYHHAKVAADAMVGKLLEMRRDSLWIDHIAEQDAFAGIVEAHADDAGGLRVALLTRQGGAEAASIGDARARDVMERDFVTQSDDGLLEGIASTAEVRYATNSDSRQRGIALLSRGVLNRQLFKVVGRAESEADQANAEEIYRTDGRPDRRRELEERAAAFAGIRPGWHVILWVPNHNMRMKIADVLVDLNGSVAPLSKMPSTSDESMAIVQKHQRLWAVSVYAHPSIADAKVPSRRLRAALSWLRDAMDIRLADHLGNPVPTVPDLLIEDLASTLRLPPHASEQLRTYVTSSGYSAPPTYRGAVQQVISRGIADEVLGSEVAYPYDEL